MKYISIVTISLLSLIFTGFSDKTKPELDVTRIPPEIKKGADAVVRFSETTMHIYSDRKVVIHKRYSITILNEEGKTHGYLVQYYDKTSKVKNILGVFYDRSGKRIEAIGDSDVEDYSAVSSVTLYQDDRVKVYIPELREYPYTVVYEYETRYDGMISYPSWRPQSSYRLGIENASFHLINETNNSRFKCQNIEEPEIIKEAEQANYNWSVSQLTPINKESLSGPISDRVPVVYLAPNEFYFEKTRGDMSSWAGVGQWISDLNNGKQDLSPETREKIWAMVKDLPSKREKAKVIYQYMQTHTRYVSVQLGIGGYQPYPASFVDEKGYGDCKALSNYTKALLEAGGVEARYTLVKAESNNGHIMTDFPSNQFNHIIICIPDDKDSIWLECTSQRQPFNFLGSFTCDRDVLMISGKKGVLVHSPSYTSEQNIQYRNAKVILDENGDATVNISTRYGGLQYENADWALLLKGEDLKKRYYEVLDIPDFTIQNIHFEQVLSNKVPEIHETIDLRLKKYMSLGGKRGFLPLNLMNKTTLIPKQLDERKSDLVLTYPFMDADTIIYIIPEKFAIDYVPSDVNMEAEFGKYQSSVTVDGQKITYVRKVTARKGRYPKEMFEEFASYRKKVVKADRCKVLLKPVN